VQAPPARPCPPLMSPSVGDGIGTIRPERPGATAPPPSARKLPPPLRKALVAAHVLIGVGWFGITFAKLVLEIVAFGSRDQDVTRSGLLFMQALDRAVFPPVALATLATGILLSVGTAWGLFRHWWIVVKLVLTLGVIVTGVAFVGAWIDAAVRGGGADGSASLGLISWGVAHVVMLGAATIISVLKPWGKVRPGR
jgi:hypothetical protein